MPPVEQAHGKVCPLHVAGCGLGYIGIADSAPAIDRAKTLLFKDVPAWLGEVLGFGGVINSFPESGIHRAITAGVTPPTVGCELEPSGDAPFQITDKGVCIFPCALADMKIDDQLGIAANAQECEERAVSVLLCFRCILLERIDETVHLIGLDDLAIQVADLGVQQPGAMFPRRFQDIENSLLV